MDDKYTYLGTAAVLGFLNKRTGHEYTLMVNDAGGFLTNESTKESEWFDQISDMKDKYPDIARKTQKMMKGILIEVGD